MRYTVMLRERSPGYYVAVAPAIPECRAEGSTRQETLELLRLTLEDRMCKTEVTSIEVSTPQIAAGEGENPWLIWSLLRTIQRWSQCGKPSKPRTRWREAKGVTAPLYILDTDTVTLHQLELHRRQKVGMQNAIL